MCSRVAHQLAFGEGPFSSFGPAAGLGMAGSSNDAAPPQTSQAKQRAGPPWVQEVKKRMPRHQDEDAAEEWPLDKTTPPAERWYQAEQFMLKQRNEGATMPMEEAYDMIRRDLSCCRAAWYPQKWTTMVEGRPVQVHLLFVPL